MTKVSTKSLITRFTKTQRRVAECTQNPNKTRNKEFNLIVKIDDIIRMQIMLNNSDVETLINNIFLHLINC